jgi:hypothetical protein
MAETLESQPNTQKQRSQLKGFVVSLLIMAAWMWGLHWLFARFTGTSYFRWYIQNGTLIGIVTAFLALVWQGLEAQTGLLSWHPGRFLASCMSLAAVFYATIAVNLAGPLDGLTRRAEEPVSILEALWDTICAVLMALLMGVAVFSWVVVIAPCYYVVTLVTGAPARREIRGTGRRLVVQTEGYQTTILDQPSTVAVPEQAVDVSFGVRPFALTNALNAAVLFLAKLVLPVSS